MASAQYTKELSATLPVKNDICPFLPGNPVTVLDGTGQEIYGVNHPAESRYDERIVNAGNPSVVRSTSSVSLKYGTTTLDGSTTEVSGLVPLLQDWVHDDAGILAAASRLRVVVLINGNPITRVAQSVAGPSAGEFSVRPNQRVFTITYTDQPTAADEVVLTDGLANTATLVADTDFAIGADADATAQNLIDAINADATIAFTAHSLDTTAGTLLVTHDVGTGTPTITKSAGLAEYTISAFAAEVTGAVIALGTTYGNGTKFEVMVFEADDVETITDTTADIPEQIACYSFMTTESAAAAIMKA